MSENIGTNSETKVFPTLHVASALTGIALCDGMNYARMAEVSEWAVGHRVWTHELGDKRTLAKVRDAILAQLPDLPSRDAALLSWQEAAEKAVAAYGDTVTLARGTAERDEGPIASLDRMLSEGVE